MDMTRLRETGVGFTYNIGRLGGAIAPAVVGVMAESIPLMGDPGAGTLAVGVAGAAGRNMSREE